MDRTGYQNEGYEDTGRESESQNDMMSPLDVMKKIQTKKAFT